MLEQYRPMGQSLDWELGQLFYLKRGHHGFLDGEVPYLVNNDGMLSTQAARLFFAGLEERRRTGAIPVKLQVLEFGSGSCLFARGFVRAFERICRQHGTDYCDRLWYVAADHSEAMLRDAERYGVLPKNGRVLLALADAVKQDFVWLNGEPEQAISFDAIFLNYLLDCLPAAMLRRAGSTIEELHVQTELCAEAQRVGLLKTGLEQIVALASGPKMEREDLIDLYPLFNLRCQYRPVGNLDPLFLDEAARLLEEEAIIVHSYAALACLEASIAKLRDGGFILISDYSSSGRDHKEDQPHEQAAPLHQHFGPSTAIGVNFHQLKARSERVPGAVWLEPETDDPSLIVRLFGLRLGEETGTCFRREFDQSALNRLREPHEQARRFRDGGANQVALDRYREAIRLQPENWLLIAETALFCESVLQMHDDALALARLGLDLNPINPDLWNTLGDSLYSLGRRDEANEAFEWALRLSPSNVRARYNLVYTLTSRGDLKGALALIADAFSVDTAGEFTERLLQRQKEILQVLKQRSQRISDRKGVRIIDSH